MKININPNFRLLKFIILTVVFAQILPDSAQTTSWAYKLGGGGDDNSNKVIVDDTGNILVAGHFSYNVDFDPGTGTKNLSSYGYKDVFIAKYKPNGSLVWALQLGGTQNDIPADIKLDGKGNIYLIGNFMGTIDCDPGIGSATLTQNGTGITMFVCKLNQAGKYRWAKKVEAQDFIYPKGLDVDAIGNANITGNCGGSTFDFDPGPNTVNFTNQGSSDAFICRFDSSGNFKWVNAIGGKYDDFGISITSDSKGYIYAGGDMQDSVIIKSQSGNITIKNLDNFDGYIFKQDLNGKLIWVKLITGTLAQVVQALHVDDKGDIYAYGEFSGNTDFKVGTDTSFRNSNGGYDLFVAKYDSMMALKWVSTFGGSGWEYGYTMAVTAAKNVYITGAFNNTADFDPGQNTRNLVSKGSDDIFFVKLDNNGNFTWGFGMGSATSDAGNGITADKTGYVYACGVFLGTIDCDPGSGTLNLTSTSSTYDGFFMKIKDCSTTTSAITPKACGIYTAPSGKKYSKTGKYTDIIKNSTGCDSVISIDLTVTTVDTAVSVNGGILTSMATGATYQWLNCNTGFSPISGQTGKVFIPSANGNYAVKITQNGCTDTSSCIAMKSAAVKQIVNNDAFIYPNPVEGVLVVELANSAYNKCKIFNLSGACILEKPITGSDIRLDLSTLPSGIYFIKIEGAANSILQRIVKY